MYPLKGGEVMDRFPPACPLDGDEACTALLSFFLGLPLTDTEAVFACFSSLPNAVEGRGERPMEHYLYVPGEREDRILLVAHADTIWDTRYGVAPLDPHGVKLTEKVFHSADPRQGIGADDRAGCAMLWALRESGHSLLLLDGEEKGKIGARFLRDRAGDLFREINTTHRMMIALDAPGTHTCIFDQVDYTPAFRSYVENRLEVRQGKLSGGSDLQVLCHRICGVNYGVGYLNHHTAHETLPVRGWIDAYRKLTDFLEESHPRFPISKKSRAKRKLKALLRLPRRLCGKLKRILRG